MENFVYMWINNTKKIHLFQWHCMNQIKYVCHVILYCWEIQHYALLIKKRISSENINLRATTIALTNITNSTIRKAISTWRISEDKKISHINIAQENILLRGYHMGGSVIWFLSNEWWCDITNERGTSEWVISHQHEFDKIISQCHPRHVIIFLSYTTTPGLIEILSIPITPIYIIQAHTVTF